jgi:hypothetical protein
MIRAILSVLVGVMSLDGLANANVLFEEGFEGGLVGWLGQGGATHHAIIVDDPLRPSNHAVTFTHHNSGGDLFSPLIAVQPGMRHILSFEYLGRPSLTIQTNLGGFIGYSEAVPGKHTWTAATELSSGAEHLILDDGQWHAYMFEFDAFHFELSSPGGPGIPNMIRVMLEDAATTAAVGDVFFDNVNVRAIPEPSAIGIVLSVGACMVFRRSTPTTLKGLHQHIGRDSFRGTAFVERRSSCLFQKTRWLIMALPFAIANSHG